MGRGGIPRDQAEERVLPFQVKTGQEREVHRRGLGLGGGACVGGVLSDHGITKR